MPEEEYSRAIALSRKIAADVGTPRFYIERTREVALSRDLFAAEPLVARGLALVAQRGECPGHGLRHVEKVAVDLGALILIEAGDKVSVGRVRRLVLLAHLAGILHDIRRTERDHAERGAEEAKGLLTSFPLQTDERQGIADAIRNHEAFRSCRAAAGHEAQLLSDALYDADKFRWGPDNFTDTLWAMLAPRGISLQALLPRFLPSLEGIRKVRESFRTPTGKEYGPDFIDRGLLIGRRVYAELING